MKGYSCRRMRKEYMGVLRLPMMGCVVFLTTAALSGAMLKAFQADSTMLLIAAGICLAAALGFFGAYLIVSDEKRMIQKTAYGQALSALGDANALIAEIDDEAEKRCQEHGSFALLEQWIMVYYLDGSRLDPYRVCTRPIPRKAVREIRVDRMDQLRDPEKRRIQLYSDMGRFTFLSFQQRDVDELHAWMEKRGPKNI